MSIRGMSSVRAAFGVFAGGLLLSASVASSHIGNEAGPPGAEAGITATTAAAVKEAFRSAMVSLRSIEEPASPALRQQGQSMSPAEISNSNASLMAVGSRLISEHFAGQAASTEALLLRSAVASSLSPGPNAALVGSGISNIDFTSLDVTAAEAVVHATVSVWTELRLRSLTGSTQTLGRWTTVTRSSKEAFVDTMLLQGGKWVVVTNSWQYVPGYAP